MSTTTKTPLQRVCDVIIRSRNKGESGLYTKINDNDQLTARRIALRLLHEANLTLFDLKELIKAPQVSNLRTWLNAGLSNYAETKRVTLFFNKQLGMIDQEMLEKESGNKVTDRDEDETTDGQPTSPAIETGKPEVLDPPSNIKQIIKGLDDLDIENKPKITLKILLSSRQDPKKQSGVIKNNETRAKADKSPLNIPLEAKWAQNGVIVAGGHGKGNASNQLHAPLGLYVDEYQTMLIADCSNDRIMEWKSGAASGRVVAGGNGEGNRTDQLHGPTDVIVDEETDSLIICDSENRRVIRWSRRIGTTNGETIIDNIDCYGLTMDDERSLYITDYGESEVRRYRIGETNGTLVAGGDGDGDRLNQLSQPGYVFVDRDHSVYVSDYPNHRVIKWVNDAKEGIVVTGGQNQEDDLRQLSDLAGVFVDALGTVYVADEGNNRVMRWYKGATQGNVIVDGNDEGNQLEVPYGLSFDRHGNLYVTDYMNNQVLRYSIEAD